MMKNLKLLIPLLAVALSCAVTTCKTPTEENSQSLMKDVMFEVPASLSLEKGTETMEFRVQFQKAPLQSDQIVLASGSDRRTCSILETSVTKFTISIRDLWNGFLTDGPYTVFIKRGSDEVEKGKITINVVIPGDGVEPASGSTVYGLVACDGTPLSGVAVSDGFEVVQTDAKGVYQMKSKKKHGYVFVTLPSGYEAPSDGVRPLLYKQLTKSSTVVERIDFSLKKVSGQDHHTMLVFGDIHLANRNDDRKQFSEFVKDVNAYTSAHASDKIYALTLGDMTWDLYWKDNKYGFAEYLEDAKTINGIQIFHTIGNHDHSMYFKGDFETVAEYKEKIAPTYYSFNIGKVHYIVLDDIECTNSTPASGRTDGAFTRTYNCALVSEEFEWLAKDLALVPKSTPVVVTMHAPLYTAAGGYSMSPAAQFESTFAGFDQVQVFTGHTHKVYNVDRLDSRHFFEHNAGAVCATWWWSGKLTPGVHIGTDGAPGGYTIVDINGTAFKWVYKATGRDASHQFRSYDRNQIEITANKYVPKGNAAHKEALAQYTTTWGSFSGDNYVYLNIWNYDPSWTIEVKENGNALQVTHLTSERDPLHIIAYTAKRLDANASLNSDGSINFDTGFNRNMFRVKASSATSTLEIKVTDRFGNVYTESMKRPKEFSTDAYKQ
ncbi:MAG: calcineurin-like phosphoesterase C-terminal domain-containing protein [Bacteroidales bacterium]|nr:calcineurin-like phosphoesterase C-terminal domain-containing protein [Bacteroidales bacterium]